MMLEMTWSALESKLVHFTKGSRALIVCVGNPVRGDDGVGQALFRGLTGKVVRLRLLDCGTSPQDCVEEAVRVEPNLIIFVNAVHRSS